MTPDEIERARELRKIGTPWSHIGRELGYDGQTVHYALDPAWAARRRERINRSRRSRNQCSKKALNSAAEYSALSSKELAARLAEIPEDDRDLTGRIFGDPPSARSALAQRGGL